MLCDDICDGLLSLCSDRRPAECYSEHGMYDVVAFLTMVKRSQQDPEASNNGSIVEQYMTDPAR